MSDPMSGGAGGGPTPAAGDPLGGGSDVNKLKHLEMIQAVITRMAGNSFLIKGWCVTLVAAIIALASKDDNKRFIAVAFYPILMFWLLDGYFLHQERLFRRLYDAVRLKPEAKIDFSMKTVPPPPRDPEAVPPKEPKLTWPRAIGSRTLFLFYGVMIGAVLLSMLIVLSAE